PSFRTGELSPRQVSDVSRFGELAEGPLVLFRRLRFRFEAQTGVRSEAFDDVGCLQRGFSRLRSDVMRFAIAVPQRVQVRLKAGTWGFMSANYYRVFPVLGSRRRQGFQDLNGWEGLHHLGRTISSIGHVVPP